MKFNFFVLFLITFCKLSRQSDELIKITLSNDKLEDYFEILKNHKPDIDEITNPRYIFGGSHKMLSAKWLLSGSDAAHRIENELKEKNLEFSLISEINRGDTPSSYDVQKQPRHRRAVVGRDTKKIRTQADILNGYHTYDQVIEWMRFMKIRYPNVVDLVELGVSLHGRKLMALKLGYPNQAEKQIFWFDSAIHAREWTTVNSIMYSITRILDEQKQANSLMVKFLKIYDIYFLIIANPDGFEFSLQVDKMWRKNMRGYSQSEKKCFGVDLNRNFDISQTNGKTTQCDIDYCGPYAGSEPESKAIKKFILSKSRYLLSFISVHSYGSYWILNRDISNFPSKNEFLDICGKALFALKRIKKTHNYDFQFGTPKSLLGYSVAGATDTWAQLKAGAKYAYSIEIGPSDAETHILVDGLGFHIDEKYIKDVAQTIYDGLYAYMSTFVEPIPESMMSELRRTCSNGYEDMRQQS